MKRPSKPRSWQFRAIVFAVLPCALGLGAAQYARWADAVWLTDAGWFWPYTLSAISAAILIRLVFSPFDDATSAVAAWLTLLATWFYAPMWATAVEVPYAAAVISREGRVILVRDTTRNPEHKVWFLTDRAGTRIVHNVSGKLSASGLELEYSYAAPYIATRPNGEDLSATLTSAAAPILRNEANGTRTSKIALMQSRTAQESLVARICRAAVGEGIACPIKMSLSPEKDATAPGGTWSTQYSESEAIEEKHLASLVELLTSSDASLVHREKVFALLLQLAGSSALLAQVALKSHLLDDGQFDEVISRILASPSCGDAAALVLRVNRLSEPQRRALRTKALDEAAISTIVENAAALRVSDAELARLAPRMRPALLANPVLAVRVLDIFGDRLPPETQRDAVEAIVDAKASYALSAMERLNFSHELRLTLLKKILSDADFGDFSTAHLSKEKLQDILTPLEMRALIAMAVKRSETSEKWHDFALESLPIPDMTLAERRALLNELLFKSPKAALEFVSKNRSYLDPTEVSEITRDYTRTITPDFCLHLSHRNKNWRTNYFSEDQLQIFRDCARRE
jgi:hypothetical protein